jgi:glyoxylase-like metal-dependent hydrolase (beta-lactamase superfamily II)
MRATWLDAATIVPMLHLLFALLVAPRVFLIPGSFVAGQQPDGNTVVFRGDRGLLVVDTGRHASHTRKIVDFAHEQKLPVTAVVNTHWHLDHIGGNALLRREYPHVRIYASDALAEARKGFLASYAKQLEEMIAKKPDATYSTELQLVRNADALMPDVVIGKSQQLTLAGHRLDVHLERNAVTAGDVWLYEPSTRVLVAGDLVTLPAPFLDTACPSKWQAALDGVAKVDFETVIPGHGAPMTRADFERYRTAFKNLIECTEMEQTCVELWLRDAKPLLKNEDAERVRSIVHYYIGNVLRGDPAKLRERCD